MALLSVAPLAPRWCVHKSLVSSSDVKIVRRTISTSIRMCRRTTVSGEGVQRRIANHHSNLWDDNFIQSLSTPYGATSYHERAQKLIGEVKEMINSISVKDGDLITPCNDLLMRLSIVDSIERLGIDRHFKSEIKSALDYVYSYWNEKGIGCGRECCCRSQLNSTALGFRTLRLHGYPVSSDILERFKEQNGQFACSAIQTDGEIRSVLNLFRASLIAFPGEKVMEEAEIFSTKYLKEAILKLPVCSLSREISYVLEYSWHINLPRLEARNYIDVFGQDPIYLTPNMKTQKLLELAKLEFNMFHSLQQQELKLLSRWWKDSGFSQMTFPRHRHVEYYTLASCIDSEPQDSSFRLGFAKISHLGTVLDDIYDTFGTMDELELFTTAVKRWHPSATEWLPEYMKGVYMVLYETVNEMAGEAEKSQGRDTLNYARNALEAYIDAYMKEAKWIFSGFLPTFEEYLDNGKVSFGYRIGTLQPILTLGIPFLTEIRGIYTSWRSFWRRVQSVAYWRSFNESADFIKCSRFYRFLDRALNWVVGITFRFQHFPHHILQEIDFPSRLNDVACSILRLKGDIHTYQAERSRGEKSSCISCYMEENPESTEEDAINHINSMVDKLLKELNWEYLRPDSNVPITSKKHAFDILRAFYHLYKYRDGFSVANYEIKNLVMTTVIEPVPL